MSAYDQGGSQTGARTRVLHQDRRLARRSVIHTIVAIIPGAGLLGTRYRRLGAILLGILATVLVVGALVVFAKGAVSTALNIAVNPTSLMFLIVLTVVVAVVWILSIVLTHAGTVPRRTDRNTRRGLRILTAVMCVLVALPAFQVVRFALIQRDVVGTVFSGPSLGGLTPSDGAAAPDPSSSDPWSGVDRVNLLLVGSDAGSDRQGLRTDSMVVASIDPQTGHATLISLPRNLERAPVPANDPLHSFFPDGFYCPTRGTGHDCLLNAVWAEAVGHKDLYPGDSDPGLTALRHVIGATIGLNIDYSTVIDLDGFEALVNAMGGVKVNVTERLPINGYHPGDNPNLIAGVEGWIEPGEQTLNGHQALWYARSRLTTSDYSRMRRQRCLIGSILGQVNPVSMLGQYPQLADVAKQNISTDIPVAQLPAWVALVQRVQKGGVSSLTFTSDNINPGNPNFAKMRSLVSEALAAPTTPSATSTTPSAPPTTTSTPTRSSKSSKTTATPTPTITSQPTPTGVVNVADAC